MGEGQGTINVKHDKKDSTYNFDHVCGEDTTQASFIRFCRLHFYNNSYSSFVLQEEIFALAGKPMVNSFLDGFNPTIFAYGQTVSRAC